MIRTTVVGALVACILSGCGTGDQAEPTLTQDPERGTALGPRAEVGAYDLAGSPVRVYLLVGGDEPSQVHTDVFRDGRLSHGELFIIPQDPLRSQTAYELSMTVMVGSGFGREEFSQTWQFATGSGTRAEENGLDEINAYRQKAGVPALSWNAAYAEAAIKHAGYQRIQELITHDETNERNPLFVHHDFFRRIITALGTEFGEGEFYGPGIDTVHEGISSRGDPTVAIDHLWNSVYHRQPMMRATTTIMGAGNSADARAFADHPALNLDPAYYTVEYGGDLDLPVSTSYWPSPGERDVPHAFNSDSEGPDPIDPGNGRQTPATEPDDWVGPPIHVVLPTLLDISGCTITLRPL